MKRTILTLALVFTSFSWAVECSYLIFTPEFLRDRLVNALQTRDLELYVPADLKLAAPADSLAVVRGRAVVGYVQLASTTHGLNPQLLLSDVNGAALLRVDTDEQLSWTEITIWSVLKGEAKVPFLTVLRTNLHGTSHYVGASDLGFTLFKSHFEETWNRALKILMTTSNTLKVDIEKNVVSLEALEAPECYEPTVEDRRFPRTLRF